MHAAKYFSREMPLRQTNKNTMTCQIRTSTLNPFLPRYGTPLVLLLTFDHNYANTRPILKVQRPLSFNLVSLERVCNRARRYSNHSPHGNSYKIMVRGVDPLLFFGIFFFLQKSRFTHHTLTKSLSSMMMCRQTMVLLDL